METITNLQNLVDSHLEKLESLAGAYKDLNPYKQEFAKHLLYDYLYDVNASYNEDSIDEMISKFNGRSNYQEALNFDINHIILIDSVVAQVFDNNIKEIEDYSEDPAETIDISQNYLDEFYNLYNEYIK